jgi:hypothetical protein
MPKTAKIKGPAFRAGGPQLSEEKLFQLCAGFDYFANAYGETPTATEAMRKDWLAHRAEVTAYAERLRPGHKPWAWYAFELGEPEPKGFTECNRARGIELRY